MSQPEMVVPLVVISSNPTLCGVSGMRGPVSAASGKPQAPGEVQGPPRAASEPGVPAVDGAGDAGRLCAGVRLGDGLPGEVPAGRLPTGPGNGTPTGLSAVPEQ